MNLGGTTAREKYLVKLCHQSFLSLWTYPNLFTPRGLNGTQKEGKELCDLLVVFDNNILIFSDKECGFNAEKGVKVCWNRRYKNAINKSIQQLDGAEHWIKSFPSEIYEDKKCLKKLPFSLASKASLRIHKIAIVSGIKEACMQFYRGGIGSLKISTSFPDFEIKDERESDYKAFCIGYPLSDNGPVHVFDESFLDIIMTELDTAEDFICYLQKKEELFAKIRIIEAPGEEEILAHYLTTLDSDERHGFNIPQDIDIWGLEEGLFSHFTTHEVYKRKKEDDKVSYFWDYIIECFNQSYKKDEGPSKRKFEDYEQAIRVMAKLDRLARRAFSKALIDLKEKPLGNFRTTVFGSTAFVFHSTPFSIDQQGISREMLQARMITIKQKEGFSQIKDVVGLLIKDFSSWTIDFLYYFFINEGDEKERILHSQEFLRLETWKTTETPFSVSEYPDLCGA